MKNLLTTYQRHHKNVFSETITSTPSCKRKTNVVPKLIDNKRKYLEKNLVNVTNYYSLKQKKTLNLRLIWLKVYVYQAKALLNH